MKFTCPHCGQSIAVETMYQGVAAQCPSCGKDLTVPEKDAPSEQPEEVVQTMQSSIDRAERTISQYMQEQKIEGGVDLSESSDGDTASKYLTAEQGRKYKLGRVVATGGMGAILDAKEHNLRRNVAMKVVLNAEKATKEHILRFIEEAQVTAQLQHPSIVPIYELGVDVSGNVFYTMKMIHGETLKAILKNIHEGDKKAIADYPLPRLLNIFQRVCDAIAFAHHKHVIHRDLKPENIMIGEYGEVQVMDWGLAKVLGKPERGESEDDKTMRLAIDSVRKDDSADIMKTMDGAIMGTPGFMAPEQAEGALDNVDERSDIYSLGAILYNILTLNKPIASTTLDEFIERVSSGDIPHPTQYNPTKTIRSKVGKNKASGTGFQVSDSSLQPSLLHCPGHRIPDSLSAVAMKALATDRKNRYQSVKDLQSDIEAYQNGFATSAEEAGAWKQATLFIRRNKTASIAAAVVALALIVGGGIAIAQGIKAKKSLNELTGTAPTFYTLAQEQVSEQKFTQALTNINYAISLVPEEAKYHSSKGNILQSLLQIDAAASEYEAAVRYNPDLPHARANLMLCRKIVKENAGRKEIIPASLAELMTAMQSQDRYPEAVAVSSQLEDRAGVLTAMLEKMCAAAGLPPKSLAVQPDGTVSGNMRGPKIDDLKMLKGIPVSSLNIAGSQVSDLSPLSGAPLTNLIAYACPNLKDLSGIQGTPLKSLNIPSTGVADLSPLKGMQLTSLFLGQTWGSGPPQAPVKDLSALKGMPLTLLNLDSLEVSDLSPLAGMPLKTLSLKRTKLRDLTPLKGMPLEELDFEPDSVVTGFDEIRAIKSLKKINNGSVPIFWRRYDAGEFFSGTEFKERLEKAWPGSTKLLRMGEGKTLALSLCSRKDVLSLEPLKGMPLSSLAIEGVSSGASFDDLSPLEGMPLTSLEIRNAPKVTDFTPLKGMHLNSLVFDNTGVGDLTPLKGMHLTSLTLKDTGVTDLTPLKGMPLTSLAIAESPIKDLTPLEGMPIAFLTLGKTQATDLKPLEGLPVTSLILYDIMISDMTPFAAMPLETLFFNPGKVTTGLDKIRGIKSLRMINKMPAVQFWQQYDAKTSGAKQ